jgi:hypothetical protein
MRAQTAITSLLPQEHGAYGQLSVVLATAFVVSGVTAAGVLFAVAVVAAFMAHEPAAVLLGHRGGRARRSLSATARPWLAVCLVVLALAGGGAAIVMDPAAWWSIAVPIVPAILLALATARGRDKSVQGELVAALACAGVALPVCIAGGLSAAAAAAVATPFALLFTASTLAVRTTILKVRGGGDARAAGGTRRATFFLAALAIVVLSVAVAREDLSAWVLAAAAPGLLTAVIIAAHPPSPARLRTVGWSLVAVSVLTAAIVVAGN